MEEGLNWEMIICVEIILLFAILVTLFYGVYIREHREIEEWKEKCKNER